MGQAQLLLIVLGVVLVGIAIIAGIQAYDTNNRKASVDALTHDAIRYASDWQMWAQKPAQFGGPTVYGQLNGTTSNSLQVPQALGLGASPVVNSNGSCAFTVADPGSIVCSNTELGTSVTVQVAGLDDQDISITASNLGS